MPRFISWFSLLPVLIVAAFQVQADGFGINATRLIYPENASSISLTLRNTQPHTPYLVQTSISRQQQTLEAAPFSVTPPLFRLEPMSVNQLRIAFTGASLPGNRESVFYLHAKAIPASMQVEASQPDNGVQGSARFGVGNIIKLFYRPTGLRGSAEEAQKGLQFTRVPGGLKVSNPSPYFVSLAMLEVDGKKLALDTSAALMLAPEGSHTWPVAGVRKVKWQTINDTGGTSAFNATLP
ncbi:fimbrial biogenesis chaperone [Serratia fonticola]|uniref:fimbrial biogenesis chaperone n=1 Tax=Serratia fonticola TaxID=47917 RepID=UPI001647DB06|nr:molecular chaperone [Serratia fonticola]MBC3219661.1 molecular chaperone [Serratia fonticola]